MRTGVYTTLFGHYEPLQEVAIPRHNDPRVVAAVKAWWQEVAGGSYRDQLSFNYSAWKLGFPFNALNCHLRDNHLFNWLLPAPNRIPYGFDDAQYLALNPDEAAATAYDPKMRYSFEESNEYRVTR